MAQLSPTSILYGQALALINSLKREYIMVKDDDPIKISEIINVVLEKYNNKAGTALTEFNPIIYSEIPSSSKFNKFLGGVQTDINLIEDQIDILRASSISTHNLIKTEILKAQNENNKLQNKLKTLELYSNVSNDSVLYFGDSFISEDSIDWSFMTEGYKRASILNQGYLSLGISEIVEAINEDSDINILEGSNGLLGNNQELRSTTPEAANTPFSSDRLRFKAEFNRNADMKNALDSMPITWFEFEKYLVSDKDRAETKNYNFTYTYVDSEQNKYLKSQTTDTLSEVSWADGPSDGILKLNLEIDIKEPQFVNIISLSPFGLIDNSNNPIKILQVSVSEDKNEWNVLSPENVWIVNSLNKRLSFSNTDNIAVSQATWMTSGSLVRYVRFVIEQPSPIDCNIGHLYYIPKNSENINYEKNLLPSNSFTSELLKYNGPLYGYYHDEATPIYEATPSIDATPAFYPIPYNNVLLYGGNPQQLVEGLLGYQDFLVNGENPNAPTYRYEAPIPYSNLRVQGPVPTIDDPSYYYGSTLDMDNLIQKIEYFKGKRWVIALRDINMQSISYEQSGTIISKKFNIPGIVDRIALDADIYIPEDFSGSDWIKFYVSPNDGQEWFRISRIQDNYSNIPEIIAFNDPINPQMRENGVSYVTASGTLNAVRLKIEIERPSTLQYLSPIIKSYKLKIIKR